MFDVLNDYCGRLTAETVRIINILVSNCSSKYTLPFLYHTSTKYMYYEQDSCILHCMRKPNRWLRLKEINTCVRLGIKTGNP